jgi:hypothetical protein
MDNIGIIIGIIRGSTLNQTRQWKNPLSMYNCVGKSSTNGGFSSANFDYWRVNNTNGCKPTDLCRYVAKGMWDSNQPFNYQNIE